MKYVLDITNKVLRNELLFVRSVARRSELRFYWLWKFCIETLPNTSGFSETFLPDEMTMMSHKNTDKISDNLRFEAL